MIPAGIFDGDLQAKRRAGHCPSAVSAADYLIEACRADYRRRSAVCNILRTQLAEWRSVSWAPDAAYVVTELNAMLKEYA